MVFKGAYLARFQSCATDTQIQFVNVLSLRCKAIIIYNLVIYIIRLLMSEIILKYLDGNYMQQQCTYG